MDEIDGLGINTDILHCPEKTFINTNYQIEKPTVIKNIQLMEFQSVSSRFA